MILIFGALLGFISVAFGAYAEHGLRDNISEAHFHSLMIAIRYNQAHAVIISAIGLALLNGGKWVNIPTLRWSGVLFIVGTVLFSFSIYIAVSFSIPGLMNITPIGGMTIMTAWLMLLISGILARRKQ